MSWQPLLEGALENRAGPLDGATGIALALLAVTTTIELAWDCILLAAIPPRAAS